jgi:putative membrane fusion protein
MASVRESSTRKAVALISLVFLVLFLINVLPGLLIGKVETVLPVYDEYKEVITGQGLMIRDEKVYENPYNGEVFRVALEGERVPFGSEVANVLSGVDLTGLKNELMEIEKSLELLQTGNAEDYSDTLSRLQLAVSIDDYYTAHNLKGDLGKQLGFLVENQRSSTEDIANKINELEQERDILKSDIEKNVKRIYSSHSGIVSFEMDGYEEMLDPNDLENFESEYFDAPISDDNRKAAFKIVDGFEWILAVKSDLDTLEIGNTYEVIIRVNPDKVYSLKAPLIKVKEESTGALYFFKSNILLEELYEVRHAHVDIVKLKVDSLRIPKEIVRDNEGKTGVFIKEFYGVVRFRLIKIVGEDENFIFVEPGDSYGYIEDEDGKRFKTINIYTEVLLDPDKFYEGEIID